VRLEDRHGIGGDTVPNVIIYQGCWRVDDHVRCRPGGAHVKTEKGWQSISRDDSETETEYSARLDFIACHV